MKKSGGGRCRFGFRYPNRLFEPIRRGFAERDGGNRLPVRFSDAPASWRERELSVRRLFPAAVFVEKTFLRLRAVL